MTSPNTTITHRDPAELRPHSLRKHLPEPNPDDPRWHSFVDALKAGGPAKCPPIIVNQHDRFIDGGRRWQAARQLQWKTIPCLTRSDAEAALIIVESLFGQRDLPAANKCYLALGLLKEYASADEDRRCAGMAAGDKNPPETLAKGLSTPLTPDSCRVLGARWGVSHETIRQAQWARRALYDPQCLELIEFYDKRPPGLTFLRELQEAMRTEFEPQIFSGELHIKHLHPAIGGKLSTEDQPKVVKQLEFSFRKTMRSIASQVHRAGGSDALVKDFFSVDHDADTLESLADFGTAVAREAKARLRKVTP